MEKMTFESFSYDLEVLSACGWQKIVANGSKEYVIRLYWEQRKITPHLRVIENRISWRVMKPYEMR